jgi:hypothetical protein
MLTTAGHRRDSLLRHEAWNYLLGVLTKILGRQLSEEEEPLALLVSPNVCFALRSIPCRGITRNVIERWHMGISLTSTREMFIGIAMGADPAIVNARVA